MLLSVIAFLLGALAAIYATVQIPTYLSKYIAIGILAALDSVFGGICANLQKNFTLKIFLSGFFGNTLLAVLLTFIGDKLDLDIYLAAVIVFGTRLFQNFAIIRRFMMSKLGKKDQA